MKKNFFIGSIGGSILLIIVIYWFYFTSPKQIPVGMVTWDGSGAVIGSREFHVAELFMKDYPDSCIKPVLVDDEWNPDKTPIVIKEAINQGIRFFVSSHPSKCAVASVQLFSNSSALLINSASTSPALTSKDDYLLRIVADGEHEQRAIARFVLKLEGTRLLLLQDDDNSAYTEPAFSYFSQELGQQQRWKIVQRKLTVAKFQPHELVDLISEPFDALYILAGSFQPAIGNIAQLFNSYHPDAPIILTPWARSPSILDIAGPSISRIILPSQYPSCFDDPAINRYSKKFKDQFGYRIHSMAIGIRQAFELLDQAFTKGHTTPEAVKSYLLSTPLHQTTLGTVAFDKYGDVSQTFYFIEDIQKELQ